jgi:fumarate hydratase class II
MVTSLNPYVGYEKACKLAKEALASGATIRELCEQEQILSEEDLNHALDPMRMTEPQE